MRLISSGHPSPSCFPFAEIAVSFTVIKHSRHAEPWGSTRGPSQLEGSTQGPLCLEVVLPGPTAIGGCSNADSRSSIGPGAEAWKSAHSLGDSETKSLRPSLGETPLPGSTAAVSFRKGLSGEPSSPKTSRQFSGEGRPWDWGKLGSSLRESTSPICCLPALPKESAERVPAAIFTQLPGRPGCTSPRRGKSAFPSHALETVR